MQFGDQIDGGAGMDTLNLFNANETAGAIPAGVQISNIEVVNINGQAAGSTVDATDFGSAAEEIWQVGAANSIEGLAEGQAAGFRNVDVAATDSVKYQAGVESATVALDNAGDDSVVSVVGNDLTSVTVAGSVSRVGQPTTSFGADFTVNLTNDANEDSDLTNDSVIETLNLALSTDVELSIGAAEELVTLNAAESTGGIRLILENEANDGTNDDTLDIETATFGSGDDLIVVDTELLGAEEVNLDLGAGDDELSVNASSAGDATAITIALGAGSDTVNITGGNVAGSTDEEIEESVTDGAIVISDFGAGDLLNIEGFTGFSAQTAVDNAAASAGAEASLYDIVKAIGDLDNGATNVTETAQFMFEGNTYVYQDNDDNGLDDGDLLIELTGGVTLDNNNVVDTF